MSYGLRKRKASKNLWFYAGDHVFAKKIESEVTTKIVAYRIAIMGRLSEIGLIRWEIEGEKGRPGFTKSNYFTADEKMMLTLSVPEED